MKKRILSVFLTLTLCLGLFPAMGIPAKAAEAETPRIEIDGVIYEATFWGDAPDGTITSINALTAVGVAPGATDVTVHKAISFETESGGAVQTWTDKPVTDLSDKAFQGNTTLRSVDLSELGDFYYKLLGECFSGCTSLERVVLPAGMTDIPAKCFYGCTSLRQVDIPETVTGFGAQAFSNTGLTGIDLPKGLTTIGYACFDGSPITELSIPASVTDVRKIYDGYSADNNNIKTITFEGSDLSKLNVVDFPKDVTIYLQPGAKETLSERAKNILSYALVVGEEKPTLGLSIDKTSADLGTIKAYTWFDLPSETFTVTNTGNATLDGITFDWSAHRDQGFTYFNPDNEKVSIPMSLAPGESFRITVSAAQNLSAGDYRWDMKVICYRDVSAMATIKLKVEKGADGLYFQDDNAVLDFGTKNVGEWGPGNRGIDIFNGSDHDITLTAPSSQYYDVKFGTNRPSIVIKPGQEGGLSITPKVGTETAGDFTEVLHFEPGNSAADLTVKYVVKGEERQFSVSPSTLTFDSVNEGYDQPSAKTVTVKNTGDESITLAQPTATNYEVGRLSRTTLSAGQTATFTVRPKAGLTAANGGSKDHGEVITVKTSDGKLSQQVTLNFTVTSAAAVETPSIWAEEEVNQAISANLVPENLQSKYTQTCTRAEFCELAVQLYETVKRTKITQRATFTDTNDVNVQKMAGLGVVNGIGGDLFDPNGQLTREQAATILARLSKVMGKELSATAPTYADNASIGPWAADAVGQVPAAGIMQGTGGNFFSPQMTYSREQSILTVLRLYELLK